jgi:hypothetical protein
MGILILINVKKKKTKKKKKIRIKIVSLYYIFFIDAWLCSRTPSRRVVYCNFTI